MNNILFIGTFLSKTRGTKGPVESLVEYFKNENYNLKIASRNENKIFRVLDICFSILFKNNKLIIIDVYSGTAFQIANISSLISKLKRKKVVLTLHGGKLPEFAKDNIKLINKVFGRALYIQTPSLYLKEYFEKMGYEINYLPNPIITDNFPLKRTHIKPHSLLWIRAFAAIYNPLVPIYILKRLKENFSDATLTMIGPNNGLLKEVQHLIDELGLKDSVTIISSVPNIELYTYYQTHEVFLNTTSYESFGMANAEAASCGIPIISNSVGEIPFIWKHTKNILLVNNLNIKEYVDNVSLLFENKKFANQISESAHKNIQKYNWTIIQKKWASIFEKLTS